MTIEQLPYKYEPKYWDTWKVNDIYYEVETTGIMKDWYITCGEIKNARECIDFCYGQRVAFKDEEVALRCLKKLQAVVNVCLEENNE